MAKEDTELTTEERWVLQKRIANNLLPGETVGFPRSLNPSCCLSKSSGHFCIGKIFQVLASSPKCCIIVLTHFTLDFRFYKRLED